MTRTAFIGLGLAMVLLAFAVPYAARGGLRPGGGEARAAAAPLGRSATTHPTVLGGVPPLPPLRWLAPRAAGPSPASPAASAAPAPGGDVPRVVVAPRRATPTVPPSQPAPPSGGSGSFDDSG